MINSYYKNNQYVIDYDTSIDPKILKNYKEECKDYLQTICEGKKNICLLFSGGCDSCFLFYCLKELNIPFKMVSYQIEQLETPDELEFLQGISAINDYDDIINVITLTLNELNNILLDHKSKKIYYQQLNSHVLQYLIDNLTEYDFFLTGVGVEIKLLPSGNVRINEIPFPFLNNNKDKLSNLNTNRTFLSYINEELFKNNYLNIMSREELLNLDGNVSHRDFLRGLIYRKYFPKISDKKTPRLFRINEETRKIMNEIELLNPNKNIEPFIFFTREYFKALEKNENT